MFKKAIFGLSLIMYSSAVKVHFQEVSEVSEGDSEIPSGVAQAQGRLANFIQSNPDIEAALESEQPPNPDQKEKLQEFFWNDQLFGEVAKKIAFVESLPSDVQERYAKIVGQQGADDEKIKEQLRADPDIGPAIELTQESAQSAASQ